MTTSSHMPTLDHKQHWRRAEDACARERRIFGSCEGGSGGDELKKGMLDVVLGLFDGLDYDDEGLC